MEVGGQFHAPPALPPRNEALLFTKKMGGTQDLWEWSGEEKCLLPLPRFETRTLQPMNQSVVTIPTIRLCSNSRYKRGLNYVYSTKK